MIMDFPDTVWRLSLTHPALAVQEYADLVGRLRGVGGRADLEALATEAVETAVAAGAELLALVIAPDAAPAVLTAVVLAGGADDPAVFRDAVENVGGPDVRETMVLDTALGPAVVAQRVPGVEQVRARRPLALQLQAFVPAGDRTVVLTLACPSDHGWAAHQLMFCQVVRSARNERRPRRPVSDEVTDDESYENHTYRL